MIKNQTIKYWLFTFLLSFFLHNAYSQTAVQSYGQLSVSGTKIVNQQGTPIQLRGMSMFWSNNGWGGEDYYTANVVNELTDDWCIDVIRAAMGVEANGGYNDNKTDNLNKVRTIIDAAIAKGIYVIVDFHSHDAVGQKSKAIEFFTTISSEYGQYPNVIYEIFNEPLSVSWTNNIKPYAEEIITVIRKNDPNNIIVVGTPNWDQDVDVASYNPITSDSNIAYALHYYANTHKQSYRDKAQTALNNGICLFVTEYGTCDANGNGTVNTAESNTWWNFLDDNKISHCNWAVNDKAEAASALRSNASVNGGWTQFTTSGTLVRNKLKNTCPDYGAPIEKQTIQIPAKVEAEDYHAMFGIQTEVTTDIGGGENVGYFDQGDWFEFNLEARSGGDYTVDYRLASDVNTGAFQLSVDGAIVHTISQNATGGWQTWLTVSKTVNLSEGEHVVRLTATGDGLNVNYIDFSLVGFKDCNNVTNGTAYIDDCGVCSGGNTGNTPNASCDQDCEGVWGGTAYLDNCGTCIGPNSGLIEGAECAGSCTSGFGEEGVYDNFTLEDVPMKASTEGVFAWGEDDLSGDSNPNFQAVLNRDSENQRLQVAVTQGQGEYVPFGFSFGENNSNRPFSIDMSNDGSFELTLVNQSNYDLKFALTLQDINGNRISTYSSARGTAFSQAYLHEIATNIDANKTVMFTGDFTDGVYADYSKGAYDYNFDFARVTTLLITVVNQQNTGNPNYYPLSIAGAQVEVKEFKLGNCSTASNDNGTVLSESIRINEGVNFTVYPNPTSDKVKIEGATSSTAWQVYDVLGNLILNGVGETVNLTDQNEGIYVLAVEGRTIRVVKK